MTAKINARKIPAGLQETLDRVRAATVAMGQGDPEPLMRLWSRADDATLFGAWGPCKQGWDELSQTFRWVATRFGGGEVRVEDVTVNVSEDLAYTVGYERGVVVVDGGQPQPMSIRVTHIYRRDLRSAAPAEFMTRPLVKPQVKAVRAGCNGESA